MYQWISFLFTLMLALIIWPANTSAESVDFSPNTDVVQKTSEDELIDSNKDLSMTPGGKIRQILKVGTYNLWHGLDPVGLYKFREYETPMAREKRFQLFLKYARQADVDVWLLQEANMLPDIAERLATELDMDQVHQVDNCGVKLGWGLPVNFRSGLVILADRNLGLTDLGGRKLSGGFGFCGDILSLQLIEFRYAHFAGIKWRDRTIILGNLHLHHGAEADEQFKRKIGKLVNDGKLAKNQGERIIGTVDGSTDRRLAELKVLFNRLAEIGLGDASVILAGDFNASPDSRTMHYLFAEKGFIDATGPWNAKEGFYTWDFERNANTQYALDFKLPSDFELSEINEALRTASTHTRRLDYILLKSDSGLTAGAWSPFADQPEGELFASDHFGLIAEIVLEEGEAQPK